MIIQNLYQFEHDYWSKKLFICGIDEVGRGCLAGPVVTSAAILHANSFHPLLIDSKKLSSQNLLKVYDWLQINCTYSIAIADNNLIDQYNIYKTTQMIMKQAALNLLTKTKINPSLILIDAMPLTLQSTPFDQITIKSFTQGESKSASIAAASIIAKVTRDKIVTRMAQNFANYGLQNHKGYGTILHKKNLIKFKPSIIHRESFLKKFLADNNHEQQSIFC
ncbi:ribonuclease HII [Candidatus Babeliales bacterium]|nr:ribonuclease HII [Candidatus Babeliales bacterium]